MTDPLRSVLRHARIVAAVDRGAVGRTVTTEDDDRRTGVATGGASVDDEREALNDGRACSDGLRMEWELRADGRALGIVGSPTVHPPSNAAAAQASNTFGSIGQKVRSTG